MPRKTIFLVSKKWCSILELTSLSQSSNKRNTVRHYLPISKLVICSVIIYTARYTYVKFKSDDTSELFSQTPMIWITANQRLARYLHQQHDQSLDCLSLKNWLIRTYSTLPTPSLLLSEQQELILWDYTISAALKDKQSELALLSTHGLTKTAQAAWHLLKNWEIAPSALADSDFPEISAFYQWALAFGQHCKENNWVDISVATDQIIAYVLQQKLILPSQINLVGFEDISPQTQHLFDALSSVSSLNQIKRVDALPFQDPAADSTTQRETVTHKMGLENEEAELLAMAQWAYDLLDTEKHEKKIACVVPNLSAIRHQVVRVFNQVFKSTPHLFNISGGQTFNTFPLISTALDILQLDFSLIDIALLSRTLLSPFLGGAEQEYTARAALDISLKQAQESHISWENMRLLADKQANCPIWRTQCDHYLTHFTTANTYQSAHNWSQHFSEQLQHMGWPGERSLNSAEYQQVKRWQSLLEEFSSLDTVLKPLSRKKALHYFTHLAKSTVFQSETPETSIQVLGLLEATGLSFDYLWVSGMNQEDWPGNVSPNPFIPLVLQRNHHMPHASTERELEYSCKLTQNFCHSANNVIFSYALKKEDRAQMPSALISYLPAVTAENSFLPLSPSRYCVPQDGRYSLEYVYDDYGPPLHSEAKTQGDAALLKHQSACPFRAFAHIRLGATRIPAITFSMTPQERGICLHAVLEQVWKKLGDHETLCRQDADTLERLLTPIVRQVLTATAKKRAVRLKSRFIALEQQRLITHLKAWLEIEKKRPPFRVVALEQTIHTQFAGLTFKLRADREDELADGARVLIDYKTGNCSLTHWFGERPDEPQLPLYGLTSEHPIHGLIFAQILANQYQFRGVSEENCGILGVQSIDQQKFSDVSTLDAFYGEQKLHLTRLALEFQTGYAKVDPKQPEKTCRHCDLQSLCRVHEHR